MDIWPFQTGKSSIFAKFDWSIIFSKTNERNFGGNVQMWMKISPKIFMTSKKIAPFTGSVIRHIWWRHTPTFNGFYCHSCHTYDASLFHGFGPSDGAFDENWRCRVFCLLSAPIRYVIAVSQCKKLQNLLSHIFYVKSN